MILTQVLMMSRVSISVLLEMVDGPSRILYSFSLMAAKVRRVALLA